ncbi:MAG: PHP domain-containing protein [Gemmatimonadaceae bacterium]
MPRDAADAGHNAVLRYLAPLRRLRPYWWLIATVVLVLASAPFALSPLRDAVTGGTLPEASLRRSPAYVVLAPVSNVLDLLTLLSVRQHIALVITLVLLFGIWWWWRGRILPPTVTTRSRRVARVAARVGVPLVALIGVYAAGMMLPRPMAALDVGNPDILAIDFHSHTKYSHDGRPDWTPEDNRAWHRDAGFGAAYVTDHRTFEGARDAWANNPPIAAEGVVLLPGIEVVWKGEHVNVLDADRMVRGLLDPMQRDIDEQALRMASMVRGVEPVLVETLPGDVSKMVAATGPGTPGVRAIELIDGAPRGLGQGRRERTRIIHLADSLNLALVAGSNHHGWGHTATGWTLMLAPGWRGASPSDLAPAVTTLIRNGGKRSTRVIERYVADTETGIALPLTVPLVVWGMMRTLSTDERVVWIAWALALFLLMRIRRTRRAGPAPDAS